jgi:hypothetical protein
MRAFLIIVFTALLLIGCSHGITQPTTSAAPISPPSSLLPVRSTLWRAESTVVDVSATLNSCPVDNAVGQTRTVEWVIGETPSSASNISFSETTGVYDPHQPLNTMNDGRTPLYYGSRTGDQFTTIAEQDGGPTGTCFVWHGDLTGTLSPDGLTVDAVENVKYTYVGAQDPQTGHWTADDMVVRRHWTGTRR